METHLYQLFAKITQVLVPVAHPSSLLCQLKIRLTDQCSNKRVNEQVRQEQDGNGEDDTHPSRPTKTTTTGDYRAKRVRTGNEEKGQARLERKEDAQKIRRKTVNPVHRRKRRAAPQKERRKRKLWCQVARTFLRPSLRKTTTQLLFSSHE